MSIPVVLGSARTHGNGVGLAQIFMERCRAQGVDAKLTSDLLAPGLPLPTGPVMDEEIPALINESNGYADEAVRAWSQLVFRSRALVIITPQYNWSFPGPLKNALDHLYHEWHGKPIILITYGGHGGTKCAEQLRSVLEGGLKAALISDPVCITLPAALIRGSERVNPTDVKQHTFHQTFLPALDAVIAKLKESYT